MGFLFQIKERPGTASNHFLSFSTALKKLIETFKTLTLVSMIEKLL